VESAVGDTQATPLKGLRFESLEEAQVYLNRWDARWADTCIHGTTKRQVAAIAELRRRHKPLGGEYVVGRAGSRACHRSSVGPDGVDLEWSTFSVNIDVVADKAGASRIGRSCRHPNVGLETSSVIRRGSVKHVVVDAEGIESAIQPNDVDQSSLRLHDHCGEELIVRGCVVVDA